MSDGHGHIVALNLENNMTVNQKSKKIRGTAKVKMKGKDGKKQQMEIRAQIRQLVLDESRR